MDFTNERERAVLLEAHELLERLERVAARSAATVDHRSASVGHARATEALGSAQRALWHSLCVTATWLDDDELGGALDRYQDERADEQASVVRDGLIPPYDVQPGA